MKLKVLIIFFLTTIPAFAQLDVSAGMGIDYVRSNVIDHINSYAPSGAKLNDFTTGAVFFAEAGCKITPHFVTAIEYAHAIYSQDVAGGYKYSQVTHKPSLMAYYLIEGPGYRFKFGGGAGPRFFAIDETLPGFIASNGYSATGFGFELKADGNTALSRNLYADISLLLNYDISGNISADDALTQLHFRLTDTDANSFSAGIRLGLTYTF